MVERVETVDPEGWTSVLRSTRGRVVRADYRVEADEPLRRRAWSQQLEGSPFDRVLRWHRTAVTVEPAGEGTSVALEVDARGRGTARLGSFMMRRATVRQLDAALDALAGVLA